MIFSDLQQMLQVVCVRTAAMFSFSQEKKTARWDREHLVDLERSEQIYLVIRDHKCETETCFISFLEIKQSSRGREYL